MIEGTDRTGVSIPPPDGEESPLPSTRTVVKRGRPARNTPPPPREYPTKDRELRTFLTLFARGELIGGIANIQIKSPSDVARKINRFREQYQIDRISGDSTTAYYIRTVFRAISGRHADIPRVREGVSPDAFNTSPGVELDTGLDATIRYFSLLDGAVPIENPAAFVILEQTAKDYIEAHPELGSNLIHAAAIWKIREVELLKRVSTIRGRIRELADSAQVSNLTRAQRQVFDLLVTDLSMEEIAEQLQTKIITIRQLMPRILERIQRPERPPRQRLQTESRTLQRIGDQLITAFEDPVNQARLARLSTSNRALIDAIRNGGSANSIADQFGYSQIPGLLRQARHLLNQIIGVEELPTYQRHP